MSLLGKSNPRLLFSLMRSTAMSQTIGKGLNLVMQFSLLKIRVKIIEWEITWEFVPTRNYIAFFRLMKRWKLRTRNHHFHVRVSIATSITIHLRNMYVVSRWMKALYNRTVEPKICWKSWEWMLEENKKRNNFFQSRRIFPSKKRSLLEKSSEILNNIVNFVEIPWHQN